MNWLTYLIIGVALIIGILVLGLILTRLYKRTTKGIAFVRTGMGGQKVVKDGGIFVLPALHEVMKVSMNTMKLVVSNVEREALLTKDKMRVDAVVEFYLRVKQDFDAIGIAAQSLGDKLNDPNKLKELVSAKFTDALRSVAAQMEMVEMHENRNSFVEKVQATLMKDLDKNGLELETASLTKFNQTALDFFDENNAFDVIGRRQLTETIQSQIEATNAITKETEVRIAKKNQETQIKNLEIQREEREATLKQQQEIAEAEATQKANVAKTQSERERETSEARIEAKLKTDTAEIEAEKRVNLSRVTQQQEQEAAEIFKQTTLEKATQQKNVEIAKKSEEVSVAEAKAEESRKAKVKAEQETIDAKEIATAERQKKIEVLAAEKESEKRAVDVKVQAGAEKEASENRAAAVRIAADAEAYKIKLIAEAEGVRLTVEAHGEQSMNEARNTLSADQINAKVRLELITQLPSIIAESAKPAEHIDSIKIIDTGNSLNGNTTGPESSSLVDKVRTTLLKYQAQAPLIKEILGEIGLDTNMDVSSLFSQLKASCAKEIKNWRDEEK